MTASLDVAELMKNLVDKCIGPGKPNIKNCSMELLIICFQKCNTEIILDSLEK